ncbi:hypothetical protein [Variovorax sp. Varisp36]
MPASDWLPAFDALSRMGTIGQNQPFITSEKFGQNLSFTVQPKPVTHDAP